MKHLDGSGSVDCGISDAAKQLGAKQHEDGSYLLTFGLQIVADDFIHQLVGCRKSLGHALIELTKFRGYCMLNVF